LGFDDIDRDLQRIIEETQVVIYIINPGTPADVKFNIFKRINTGGLVLEPQEIRHALFQGEPSHFIAELASVEAFKATTTDSVKTHRMLDRDFANRFLAFYAFGYQNYTPDLDTFMSKAMAQISQYSEEQKAKTKLDYERSMRLNQDIFGLNAFRKLPQENEKRKPLNKALFDVFSVTFAKLNNSEQSVLLENKEQFLEGFRHLLYNDNNNQFFWAVSSATGDRNRVNYRFSKVAELLKTIIKA